MKLKTLNYISICAVTAACVGCGELLPDPPAKFEPNRVFAYQMTLQAGQSMQPALKQANHALEDSFGTPDEPKLPQFVLDDPDFAELLSMDHLVAASGPADAAGRGLFRKHCAICHGVTGNGRGTNAALLNPYPRDFRMGRFKFKKTGRGVKPLKEDIAYLIAGGIPGTPMVKIKELSEEDIAALTDYVIYLSWRGEVERMLLEEAEFFDFESGESLYDPSIKEEDPDTYDEQIEILEDFVFTVAEKWLDAEGDTIDLPERDRNLVPDTTEQLLAALRAEGDSPIKQSVENGHQLFLSDAASCAKCHGKEGRGDGQTNDYDDWTKDWTVRFRLAPDDEKAQIPLIARGALPPRKVSPRDFQSGVFRGGSSPDHIYRRIVQGIDGTPMPAAPLKPEQIWDLVNFVRSLYAPAPSPGSVTTTSGSAGDAG